MTAQSKNLLLRELDGRFADLGFSRWSHKFYGDRYDRPIVDGRQSVAIEGRLQHGYFELDTGFISIHIEKVEQLVAKFEEPTPLIAPEDVSVRPTIGIRADLEGFAAVFRKSWLIKNEHDAAEAAEHFVARVMDKAVPFWERFSNLSEVLKVLSGTPQDARKYSLPDEMTTKRAIVLAFVIDGPERARRLADAKLSVLEEKTSKELKPWLARASLELLGRVSSS